MKNKHRVAKPFDQLGCGQSWTNLYQIWYNIFAVRLVSPQFLIPLEMLGNAFLVENMPSWCIFQWLDTGVKRGWPQLLAETVESSMPEMLTFSNLDGEGEQDEDEEEASLP